LIRGFHNSTYRRMPSDYPAKTITTASGRVGGNYTIHPYQNRVLSPLECALLQTLPLTFAWGDALAENGHTRVRAMIGEAVPPLFTRQHGEVLKALLQEELPPNLLSRSDCRCKSGEGLLVTSADDRAVHQVETSAQRPPS
jgi:DNA (cytosine-5)-methyltransferase 1